MCHDLRPCGHFGSSRYCPPCQRIRKQSLHPRSSRRSTMPAGRTCSAAGCGTRLSVYNRGDRCSLCVQNGVAAGSTDAGER
jgi:hypothetical protein